LLIAKGSLSSDDLGSSDEMRFNCWSCS